MSGQMEEEDISALRDRIEGLQVALDAHRDVNKHLAAEVERLSLENDSLNAHLKTLLKKLKKPKEHENETTSIDYLQDETDETLHSPLSQQIISTTDRQRLIDHAQRLGWLIDPTHLSLGAIAGQGGFGTTYKGLWRGAEVAVKQIKPSSTEIFARELTVLSLIRHPNVVALYGAVIDNTNTESANNTSDTIKDTISIDRCWLVCEWIGGGTLSEWLHGAPGSSRHLPRSLYLRLRMALDVAAGMEALEQHDPPILHRDLKPGNILVDCAGRAKVSDMGLARVLTPDALIDLTPETGSYLYMAPEVVRHELYATQADVWSWGCVLSELLTEMKPYSDRHLTPIQVALAVADGKIRPAIPATAPPGVAELLAAALDLQPLNRPSFAVIAETMRRIVDELKTGEGRNVDQTKKGGVWNKLWYGKGAAV